MKTAGMIGITAWLYYRRVWAAIFLILPGIWLYREFLEEGLLVTLNTDNRTVSGTTLSREMEEVQKHCGIPLEEFYRIERNAVEVAFADDSVKHELWKMMRT